MGVPLVYVESVQHRGLITAYVVYSFTSEELLMHKGIELSDEHLERVFGGYATPSISANPQINVNSSPNISTVGEANVILWSNLTNSPVGTANVNQSNKVDQFNHFA